jgi:inosine-uridine nucleoside N-ribohydrolase
VPATVGEQGDYFWDPLTAVILANVNMATIEQDTLCVIEESGQILAKDGCPQVRVAVNTDAARFVQELLDTLNNP